MLVSAAVAITFALAAFTSFGLVGLALLAVSLLVVFLGQEMPARTTKGASLLSGLGLLRAQLLGHPTDQMPKGRELHELSEVLPYAVAERPGGRRRRRARRLQGPGLVPRPRGLAPGRPAGLAAPPGGHHAGNAVLPLRTRGTGSRVEPGMT